MNTSSGTLHHVLNNCEKMLDRYGWRHNNLIKIILKGIKPESSLDTVKVYADIQGETINGGTIPPFRMLTSLILFRTCSSFSLIIPNTSAVFIENVIRQCIAWADFMVDDWRKCNSQKSCIKIATFVHLGHRLTYVLGGPSHYGAV